MDGIDGDCDGVWDQLRVFAGGGWWQNTPVDPNQLRLAEAKGIIRDSQGQLYFTAFPNRVYRLTRDGVLEHLAGSGSPLFAGDSMDGRLAGINSPSALALDSQEDTLFIADRGGQRLWALDLDSHIITSVYGTGVDPQDGCYSTSGIADLCSPNGLMYWPSSIDDSGYLYVVETGHHQLIRLTVADDGTVGAAEVVLDRLGDYRHPQASSCSPMEYPISTSEACIAQPRASALSPDGNTLYVNTVQSNDDAGEDNSHLILEIDLGAVGGAEITGVASELDFAPIEMDVDEVGLLYISQGEQGSLWTSPGDGSVSQLSASFDESSMSCPEEGDALRESAITASGGVFYDIPEQRLYFYAWNQLMSANMSAMQPMVEKELGLDCELTLGDGGPAINGFFDGPAGFAQSTDGALYVADYSHSRIRKIDNGLLSTLMGNGYPAHANIGHSPEDASSAKAASIDIPTYLAFDPKSSELHASPRTGLRSYAIDEFGLVSYRWGLGFSEFPPDPTDPSQGLWSINGLAVDPREGPSQGTLFLTNASVRTGFERFAGYTHREILMGQPGGELITLYEAPYLAEQPTDNFPHNPQVNANGDLIIPMVNENIIQFLDVDACLRGEGDCLFPEPIAGQEGVRSKCVEDDGTPILTSLNRPRQVAPVIGWEGDGPGPFFIVDTGCQRVIYMDEGGTSTLVAGGGTDLPDFRGAGSVDAVAADLTGLGPILHDPSTGVLYIGAQNVVMTITP